MLTWELISGLMIFLVGLRLSAFFSGVETGFYRISFVRLSLDSHAGDRVARGLAWFVKNPGYFVATVLVGNNIANYVVTVAVGLVIVAMSGRHSDLLEILSTLVVSPLIFLLGELLPKSLYYRAPERFLRKDARLFSLCYYLFLPISLPLVWVTRFFQRFSDGTGSETESILGRTRLVQLLSQGKAEGLLTELQHTLVDGLLNTAAQTVRETMTPVSRVMGLDETTPREQIIKFAGQYGLNSIMIRRSDRPDSWYGYVRLSDVQVSRQSPKLLVREAPVIPATSTRLEALLLLRNHRALHGIVVDRDRVVGVLSERGLIEGVARSSSLGRVAFAQPG